jgi:hypothetical protein
MLLFSIRVALEDFFTRSLYNRLQIERVGMSFLSYTHLCTQYIGLAPAHLCTQYIGLAPYQPYKKIYTTSFYLKVIST